MERTSAFRVIVVLATLVVILGIVLAWLLIAPGSAPVRARRTAMIMRSAPLDTNPIREAYPDVEFRRVYPDRSDAEIDAIQRQTFAVRFLYRPWVQFGPEPVDLEHVRITEAGFRDRSEPQPWPPGEDGTSILVFGGSTTFGYALGSDDTLVARLEERLQSAGVRATCYNFGRGYYFSSQEVQLFENVLRGGVVPDIAVFVDGLNEFSYPSGEPMLTVDLERFLAPERPRRVAATGTDDPETAVSAVLDRYERNLRLVQGMAAEFDVDVLFVGQPVPFLGLPSGADNHLFPLPESQHPLVASGYEHFEEDARAGRFGPRFLWLGRVFAEVEDVTYADRVHYSPRGADVVAAAIADRLLQSGALQGS